MNTNGIARHYDRLTPEERVPLMIAAQARGDEAECERLTASARRVSYRAPDYLDLSEAVFIVTLSVLVELLDLGLLFSRTFACLSEAEAGRSKEDLDRAERLNRTVRLTAYVFVTRLDAWRRFCDETHIDGAALMRCLPAYESVADLETLTRHLAWTEAAAAEHVVSRHPDGPPIVTVLTATAELHRLLDPLRHR
jgi:hypothetical protein